MVDSSVTRRYQEPVTQRYPEPAAGERATRRFGEPAQPPPAGSLRRDELVAGRYRVLDGPLGGVTGEAEVYRCRDEHLGEEVVVKLYRFEATPKAAVVRQLEGLANPHVLRLLAHGRWRERFFEVSELCRGGVLADAMPCTEETLRALLPALLEGLAFCHHQGIVHRDLKPNNLFFRDPERTQLLIGDFGISSYLERDAGAVRETRTAASLTLDYAAPELLDGHEVGPKTDYYALGVTLLHLVLGRSPFQGLSPNDVLVAHLRGRLPLPDGLSPEFARLVRGLTLGDPERRWGHGQVAAWLRGEAPELPENAGAWATAARAGHPYPGYPEAATPRELAAALERFDAFRELLRGDIRRWAFDHVDRELAERIEPLERCGDEPPERVLGRLRLVLDPEAPLDLGERRLTSLAQLVDLLRDGPGGVVRDRLGTLLRDGLVEAWIQVGRLAGGRTGELLERLAGMRERLPGSRHQPVALDALLYTLVPGTPLVLGPGLDAGSPRDVALAFRRDPAAVGPVLARHLFGKRLDEWLRARGRPGWEGQLAFLDDLRFRYLEQPLLGVYCLCWRFDPDMPLRFAGQEITRPRHLARLIDRDAEGAARGLKLLEGGRLRAWLVGSGRIADPATLDQALLSLDMSPEAKLESVLHLLDPELGYPRLEVEPDTLYFGRLEPGTVRERTLHVRNGGRGLLNGEIVLAHYGAGLTLDQYKLEANEVDIQVRLVALGLPPGRHENILYLRSNGGEREVRVQFSIQRPVVRRSLWQRLMGT